MNRLKAVQDSREMWNHERGSSPRDTGNGACGTDRKRFGRRLAGRRSRGPRKISWRWFAAGGGRRFDARSDLWRVPRATQNGNPPDLQELVRRFSALRQRLARVSYDRTKSPFTTPPRPATGTNPSQAVPRRRLFRRTAAGFSFTVQENAILCDWPQRRQVRVLSGHVSTVTSVAFSPNSGILPRQATIAGSSSGRLRPATFCTR